ncbi:MAG: type I-U CRISPR-associated helicase/endonuclease Cas3 [Myxococcales bacterium]|nr:type I-U CRISPR-associated helicase/endonuclease Cas3 [Myxococcales bacterium]
MLIGPDDFAPFYEAAHGYAPFPWQERLARQVLETGRWPDILDVPTGAGKTSALDVALFCLAAEPRRFPRRSVLVVDRRVVVDQGAEHARALQVKLRAANSGILARVKSELLACWDSKAGDAPFEVAVLRGGMPRSDAWARRPDQPVIALSTVDQVGSRLLFRGYGVSERMTSVHAGLLGNDTLFLLDEVHLAVPFSETLLAVRRWRNAATVALPDRWQVVRMSATPGAVEGGATVFSLDPDTDGESARLARRLKAHKRARLSLVKTRGKEHAQDCEDVAKQCVEEALSLIDVGARTVAIVVNRVDTARLARSLLSEHEARLDAALLTGRMRPLDRDRVLDGGLKDRITAGRTRAPDSRPIVVAATQCIEAGADFDFDGLVTECASLDALRQRFGRLDRLGEIGETRAVILARSDLVEGRSEDPVYGQALVETWRWLTDLGSPVDFGVEFLPSPAPELLPKVVAPGAHAPLLVPTHLDVWVQTNPPPEPSPDVALWLHGPELGQPEVLVIFRADITDEDLKTGDDEAPEDLVERLTACPPSTLEALSLPLHAARAWLSQRAAAVEIADVEGVAIPGPKDRDADEPDRPVLRWAGDASRILRDGTAIRPGDTLVIPASYGGIAFDNWDPGAAKPVADLGDLAQWYHRGRATLRLQPSVIGSWLSWVSGGDLGPETKAELLQTIPRASSGDDEDADPGADIADWLERLRASLDMPWLSVLDVPSAYRRVLVNGESWTLVARKRRTLGEEGEISTEDDTASFTGTELSLDAHCSDVKRVAESFGRGLGFPDALVNDLVLAAWLHDVGKADHRFQKMLVGGSEVRLAALEAPLAKSSALAQDAAARREARLRAEYPDGFRHELLSVAMVTRSKEALEGAHDADLVLHLVGSHHGWCRPFAPLLDDSKPIQVRLEHGGALLEASTNHGLARLDSGIADRFWTLVRRYGWWGLAWLEAILRLADHRASEWAEASNRGRS